MFRHCVLFRWNPDVSDEALESIRQGFEHLREITEVVSLAHGPDVGVRDGNFDYALIVDFNSQADYKVYAGDEDHRRFIAEVMAPNVSERAGAQFEFDDA